MAETLLASYGKGMLHDPNTKYGECVTANQGTGSFGKQHTPDHFVEREEIGSPRKATSLCWSCGGPPSTLGVQRPRGASGRPG